MKIEKINENQIRCTLTREDLETHQVNLKELAYGSEKAKKLFRDMMQQAQIQFGFEADNVKMFLYIFYYVVILVGTTLTRGKKGKLKKR